MLVDVSINDLVVNVNITKLFRNTGYIFSFAVPISVFGGINIAV